MIQCMTRDSHEQVMEYLKQDLAANVFIIGDLEQFGYDSESQQLWADCDDHGNIQSVLFRFYHTYIPYAHSDFNPRGYIEIIQQDSQFEVLQGISYVVEALAATERLKLGPARKTYLCQLTDANQLPHNLDTRRIKRATVADVDRIIELRAQIPSFVHSTTERESLIQAFHNDAKRLYYIENEHGEMIASASSTAESSTSAMVVGVCTLPQYRNRGLASLCTAELCKDVLESGRKLCLFYDNPDAGRIYLRLGFEHIGDWTMYHHAV